MVGYEPSKMVRLRPRGARVCDDMMCMLMKCGGQVWSDEVGKTPPPSHTAKIGFLTFVIILDTVHISSDRDSKYESEDSDVTHHVKGNGFNDIVQEAWK